MRAEFEGAEVVVTRSSKRDSQVGRPLKDFLSIYQQGFVRVAACQPRCEVADPDFNLARTLELAREGDAQGAALMVFPELGLSGYAIDDLLLQQALLDKVEEALAALIAASRDLNPILLVGAPLRRAGRLYNCAVAIHRGDVLGVVPKCHLPNYREFYEKRLFASGRSTSGEIDLACLLYTSDAADE